MEQFKQKFIEEAHDLIQDLESSCLALNSEPDNKEHVETLFRAMHSLKGGSAMFGFDKIDAFTHQLETAYDMVRNGDLKIDDKLLDLSFKSIDHIKALLEEDEELTDQTIMNNDNLLSQIKSVFSNETNPSGNENQASQSKQGAGTYYVKFIPNKDIFKNGTNPLLIVKELCDLGQTKVFSYTDEIPVLEELEAGSCYTSWVVVLSTESSEDEVNEVFMFVDLDCQLEIKSLDVSSAQLNDFFSSLENIETSDEKLSFDDIVKLIPTAKSESIAPAPAKAAKNDKKAPVKDHGFSSIRVSSEKLDELINLVSELVTRQASLSLLAESLSDKDLLPISEDIEKISRRLRDSTFSIRLIPVESMEIRFRRLVRELSASLQKEIDFKTEGTDTELDKTIIEGLLDPMLHIIRNSIDHGIETSEERIANGKPAKGTILLKSFYSGANVYIQVIDDGKGIDTNKILKKAIMNGLVDEDAMLSNREILDLIFLPGFSTAENVTKVSGRGVGMDVVKRKISELRGEVSIETEINVGTTMTVKLPLTLSIIDGLLVTIDNTSYVIPLVNTKKVYEYSHEELDNAINNLIHVNEGHIPFANLRKEFEIDSTPPEREQVVVVEFGDSYFGLVVDHIVGEYQAVLKSLGHMYHDQEIVSGATILGDGTVALVLDPTKIIDQFTYADK